MPTCVVLDIETGPDRALGFALKFGRQPKKQGLPHILTAYAVLIFDEMPDGSIQNIRLQSSIVAPPSVVPMQEVIPDEERACWGLGVTLRMLGEDDALITFNGKSHDVPFLRAALQKYGDNSFPDYFARGRTSGPMHCDMMEVCREIKAITSITGRARWPSLKRACDAVGIPHEPHATASRTDALIRKCETDVCSTFLLYALWRAGGDPLTLPTSSMWAALAAWARKTPKLAHRMQFALAAKTHASPSAAEVGVGPLGRR